MKINILLILNACNKLGRGIIFNAAQMIKLLNKYFQNKITICIKKKKDNIILEKINFIIINSIKIIIVIIFILYVMLYIILNMIILFHFLIKLYLKNSFCYTNKKN